MHPSCYYFGCELQIPAVNCEQLFSSPPYHNQMENRSRVSGVRSVIMPSQAESTMHRGFDTRIASTTMDGRTIAQVAGQALTDETIRYQGKELRNGHQSK